MGNKLIKAQFVHSLPAVVFSCLGGLQVTSSSCVAGVSAAQQMPSCIAYWGWCILGGRIHKTQEDIYVGLASVIASHHQPVVLILEAALRRSKRLAGLTEEQEQQHMHARPTSEVVGTAAWCAFSI